MSFKILNALKGVRKGHYFIVYKKNVKLALNIVLIANFIRFIALLVLRINICIMGGVIRNAPKEHFIIMMVKN